MDGSLNNRKHELETVRKKLADLKKRHIEDLAHEVGIKGIVGDMDSTGTEEWEATRTCLWWLLNRTDYPYDQTVLNLYADLDAILKGYSDIRFIESHI